MRLALFGLSLVALLSGEATATTTHTERHPKVQCDKAGCTFTYELCALTRDPPAACEMHTFNLVEHYGINTDFMPYPKRMKPFTTVKELRGEAEARADMIEGRNLKKYNK